MRKLILSLVTVVLSTLLYGSTITLQPGITIEQYPLSYVIHFSMPDFEVVEDTIIVENNEFVFSSIRPYGNDAFDYLDEDGRPTLPFCALDLILPPTAANCQVSSVQINHTTTLTLDYEYTPAQSHLEQDEILSYDASYYGIYDNSWYWHNYQFSEYTRGIYKGLTFSFFPCHYEPSQLELTVVTDATYEITWEEDYLDTYLSTISADDRQALVYFDNFLSLPNEWLLYPPIDDDGYLIIYADAWENEQSLWDFVAHKENLGYNVFTAPISVTGSSPDDIRTYIKNIYDYPENKLKYVLLVGDVTEIPFSMGTNQDEDDPPTDIFYACLDKPVLADQWYDITPDVYIGRWPVRTSQHLSNIVTKTIYSDMYLADAIPNPINRKITLFTGTGDGENSFYNACHSIYDDLSCLNYYTLNLHDGRTLQSAGTIMRNELEGYVAGPLWMFVYRGHGGPDEIYIPYRLHYYEFDNNSVMTNSLPFQPFGFGFACDLCDIYQSGNFARSWVTSESGGVSFYGATTPSYRQPNNVMIKRVFSLLEQNKSMTIGEFVENGAAKYYNANKVVYRRRQAKKYVLYGDPSLYLYGLDFDNHTPHAKSQRNILDSDTSKPIGEIVSVSIYTPLGQLLFNEKSENIHNQNLQSGTYFVVTQTNENRYTQKLIIK